MDELVDILVVGGGHAGVEAAHAAAKMGLKTHLITMLVENIALASCNPAIGGLAKGHLVKEIDALGGVMGIITDACGLQFRTLNASKGPAVRGTRAQIDMDKYRIFARNLLLKTPNLSLSQEVVEDLLLKNAAVVGIRTNIGKVYRARKVILTTGTFLNGVVHIGAKISQNGRAGELSAKNLGGALQNLGLKMGRLKTGTCPRVSGESIDFCGLEAHFGDTPPPRFSHRTRDFAPTQLPCYITYTNEKTHEIIRQNLHLAPLFSGQIKGTGPRYCPSIEDKVQRFADRTRHQLFLEPQTAACSEYYVNGLSTSLPFDLQERVVRSIKGLENAQITRYGYAIEYDFVQPTELLATLECRAVKNLYLAGQINGTTGYEEAAAQGLMAGINAALSVKNARVFGGANGGAGCESGGESSGSLGREKCESAHESLGETSPESHRESFVLKRSEAYIGVMIDDLVTKGTDEPYRVFTSRAEYRLLLRESSAVFRLAHYGRALGLLEDSAEIERDKGDVLAGLAFLEGKIYTPNAEFLAFLAELGEEKISDATSGIMLAARESFGVEKLRKLDARFAQMSLHALEELKIECKYHHYTKKQQDEVRRLESSLGAEIPSDFVFENIPGLSREVVEKLKRFRPKTLREAAAISGITPASIEVLSLYIFLRG